MIHDGKNSAYFWVYLSILGCETDTLKIILAVTKVNFIPVKE
jgi:hypothetical protein